MSIIDRFYRLEKANSDLGYRAIVLEKCRLDPILWINDWVWTSDPRNASRGKSVNVPFTLFPRQEEYLRWRRHCLANREFGIVAKSRDSGMSWINCADQLHHWLFDSNYKGAFGSRKQSLIDKLGDPDTLFQKMRFILDTLPNWMKPEKYFDGYMRLINEDFSNVITGEAGDNIGRGGRNLLYDVDEFGFLERQSGVMAALSQNTDCLIRTSTPNGSTNVFAHDYLGGQTSSFSFHWKDDPRKNYWTDPTTGQSGTGRDDDTPIHVIYPWYEEQKLKLDELTIAQEIDIDFSASMEGICIPAKWVQAAIDFNFVMTNYRKQAGLDIATEGSNSNVLVIVDAGNKVTLIDDWNGLNTTETAYKTRDICHSNRIDTLNFDGDGVGAGVAGTLQTTSGLRFRFKAMHGGSSPSGFYWQGEDKSSKDKFYNRRAELWYLARERFRKTYELRNGIREYPTDECISIPNDQKLITQLSQPLMKYKDTGKMIIESKVDMRKRGASSPDHADALIYALAVEEPHTYVSSTAHYS